MTQTAAYLDYNATAPVRPEAAGAVADALAAGGNASSVHRFGRLARRTVEEARDRVATLAGAKAAQVVFTSGGTEANNLALSAAATHVVSTIEHESVLAAALDARRAPVDAAGVIDLAALDKLLDEKAPEMVSVMLANNETGVIQPVAAAAGMARRRGALVHCDAVQAAGKIGIDFAALGVDTLSLSAHKLGGPQGVGALVIGDGLAPLPLLRGGAQERGMRAGTENVPGIAGFGAAAAAARAALDDFADLADLRDRLEGALAATDPAVTVFGATAPRLANTSCVTMPGVAAETQVIALDLAGVAVSAGAACSAGKVTRSHVLAAMGGADRDAGCAIRVSLGWRSTADHVDQFVAAWRALYARAGGDINKIKRTSVPAA